MIQEDEFEAGYAEVRLPFPDTETVLATLSILAGALVSAVGIAAQNAIGTPILFYAGIVIGIALLGLSWVLSRPMGDGTIFDALIGVILMGRMTIVPAEVRVRVLANRVRVDIIQF